MRERFELLEKYQAELHVKTLKQSSTVHPIDTTPSLSNHSSDPLMCRTVNGILPTMRLSSKKQRDRRKLDFDTQSYTLTHEKLTTDPPTSTFSNSASLISPIMRIFADSNANNRSLSISRRLQVPNLPSILEHEDVASNTNEHSMKSYQSPLVTARESDTTEEAMLTARWEEEDEEDEEGEQYVEIELPDIHQIENLRALQRKVVESKEDYTDASSEGEEGEEEGENEGDDSSICLPEI
ncbi:hypothetical protein EON65_42425 [archaeon]|nr:MAG: hypothetical protein EON65_42425 [archaeon]